MSDTMEKQVKCAVYEMLCNLKGQRLLGKDEPTHISTLAALRRELESQIETFEW